LRKGKPVEKCEVSPTNPKNFHKKSLKWVPQMLGKTSRSHPLKNFGLGKEKQMLNCKFVPPKIIPFLKPFPRKMDVKL